MVKISEFRKTDQEKLIVFCKNIYEEMGWKWKYIDDLTDVLKYYGQGKFLVVKENNKIVGCGAVVEIGQGTGLIKRVYIDKAFRGKGVAQDLINEIGNNSKDKYRSLVLDVIENNPRARRFWEKNGFKMFEPGLIEGWPETTSPEIFEFFKKEL